ncbi:hypothetical protein Zmor_011236 [Zophobas morio]|uniref:Uncharacterized protein n=1 Tax=Zophobas morio TaxID=2755281 RepID=A0AA38ILQ2_9CUCU|nr:hypothetical protein Zmor_011236 [Zophobas morio]
MSTSDEDTSVCTPPEIRKEASNVQCDQLLPQKSKEFYLKVYAQFKDWCKIEKVAKVSENVLLVYMEEKAKNKKASSLWATFSMLKQTLKLKENVDISKYYKVIAFLKRKNDSYTPKKAAVFEKHQITKFILEAPDEIFLSSKVIFIIGIAGACRTDELCNMKMTDWYNISEIVVASSLKLTIVAVIGPKEYCKLKNKFLESFEEAPDISTHRLAAEVEVSQFVVHRTLKEQGLHPYHVQKMQALEPADFSRRVIYCEWLLQQCREQLNTLTFIVNDRLVGPYILPNRLNAAQYLEFLNNILEEQLDVEGYLGERVRM